MDEIIDCAHHAGIAASSDVVGLYRGCLSGRFSADLRHRYDSVRSRRGLVPDVAAKKSWGTGADGQEHLFELETIQPGLTWYPPTLTRKCEAVARRAREIPGAYRRKRQKLDAQLGLQQDGNAGAFEMRLRSWPDVVPPVVSAYGEINDEFLHLVRCVARAGAAHQMRRLHEQSETAARWCLG